MKILELFKTINPYESRIDHPYIIAEAGVNHEGNMDLAKRLIDEACEGGADAIKFQTYKADSIASKNSPAYWDITKESTKSQFELFQKYDTFQKSDYEELKKHCDKVGIEFLSTPFDVGSAKFLNDLVDVFKISSSDITNKPFIEYICQFGKPIILSTGASYLHEIQEAVEWIDNYDIPLALLHCVLNYPTLDENANLGMISGLQQKFPDKLIGYSDHTLPKDMKTLETAFLLGAVILEKHFTHDKTLPGNDHYHSMDKNDLKLLKHNIEKSLSLLGDFKVTALPVEEQARKNARRSIVLTKNVDADILLTEDMLTYKRPGSGISPMYWDQVIGMRTALSLTSDHVLKWDDFTKKHSDSKERVIAVIQARMGSSRFPGKMMEKLAGRPMIEWILNRVCKAKLVDEVVLATSISSENDVLEQIARDIGIHTIRGDENDVLSRFETAAKEYNADLIVRICADNPFIDSSEIDNLIDFHFKNRPDYAFNHLNRLSNNYPDGFGAEIFTRGVLEDMNRLCVEPQHREHVTMYLWDNPYAYRMETFPAPEEIAFPDLRFDVDTPEDLEYLRPIAEKVGVEGTVVEFVKAEIKRLR